MTRSRSMLTVALALIGASAALLHCAATGGDESDAPLVQGEAGSSETSTTDGSSVPGDAATDSPADARQSTHCSPDHWCREPLPSKDFDLAAVWSFAPNDAIAVGTSGMLHWDGKTWSVVPSADGGVAFEGLSSVWASGPNDVWAVAQGQRRVVHGTRAAAGAAFAWTASEADGGPTRDLVTGAAPGEVWTAGIEEDGTPTIEHGVVVDGGAPSFTQLAIPDSPFSLNDVFVSASGELWVAGSSTAAVVLHAQKKANAYVWDTSLTTEGQPFTNFPSIWGTASNDIWVLGAKADHYHRGPLPDGGAGWSPIPNQAAVALTSVWGTGKNDVWAVGYFGAVRHWDGTSWTVSQIAVGGTPIYEMLASVHGSSADDIWAVGPGVALHRRIGGEP